MKKIGIVTGATGQDGSYLAELLLEKGYTVIGLVRRSSTNTHERINKIIGHKDFHVAESDLTDPSSINYIVNRYKPDEFYNLAAQSHVATSFNQPTTTFQVNAVGVINVLEAIRHHSPHTRFYQASTSEMFGSNYTLGEEVTLDNGEKVLPKTQSEDTHFAPNSPYAVSKVAAHNSVDLYRRSYNLHASCGILFNHESERRGENFVTKKITKYIGELYRHRRRREGLKDAIDSKEYPKLMLGNLEAYRDWGYAPDYVEAMWMMLQMEKPDDYVIGTGVTHSVRDFLVDAFAAIGIKDWERFVGIDPQFYRPCEVNYLCGNVTKANTVLGWKPKVGFEELVRKMVSYDANK